MSAPPVFIVGCGHSGTSLLLAMLGTHSRIYAIPYESMVFKYHEGAVGRILRSFDRQAVLAGKARWVEKTPLHIRHIANILRVVPTAKVIVMMRDGRDVAWSLRERTGDLRSSIARWVDDNDFALPFLDRGEVTMVRYEDLVESPRNELARVLDFLGEDYESEVLTYYRSPRYFYSDVIDRPSSAEGDKHNRLRNWQINQPIFDGRGRWHGFSGEELNLIYEVAAGSLERFGYYDGGDSFAEDHGLND